MAKYPEGEELVMEGIRMFEYRILSRLFVEWQLYDETKLFDE